MGIARPCNVPSLVQVRAQRGWVQRELSCRGFSWRRRLTVLAGRAEGVQEGGTRPGKGCGRSQARRSGALSPDLRVSATDTAELSRPSRRQEEGARKTSTLGNSVSGVRLPERSLGVCQGSVPDPASRRPALGPPAAAASPRLAPRSPRLRAAGTAPPRAAPGSAPASSGGEGDQGALHPFLGCRREGSAPGLPAQGRAGSLRPALGASLTGSRPSGLSASGM